MVFIPSQLPQMLARMFSLKLSSNSWSPLAILIPIGCFPPFINSVIIETLLIMYGRRGGLLWSTLDRMQRPVDCLQDPTAPQHQHHHPVGCLHLSVPSFWFTPPFALQLPQDLLTHTRKSFLVAFVLLTFLPKSNVAHILTFFGCF